jgi:hypothetical protein
MTETHGQLCVEPCCSSFNGGEFNRFALGVDK